MAEIGLFPLELVLLPGERVPLHVFEDRYKDLIGECVADGSEFGMVLETEDGLRTVGTSTSVLEVIDTFDDGRMNVLVEGRDRFRILELTEGRSFRTAEIEQLPDDDDRPTEAEVEQAMDVFRRLVVAAGADQIDEPSSASPTLSFELAARVDFGHELKQELLELRSEGVRLRRLVDLLEHAANAIAAEREARTRASGNGKVSRS